MINSLYFGAGFVVYVLATMLTINVYNKRTTKNPSVFPMYFIFLYYTLLAAYVINVVGSEETFFVRLAQMAIYAIAAGIFFYTHYKYVLTETNYDVKKENSF